MCFRLLVIVGIAGYLVAASNVEKGFLKRSADLESGASGYYYSKSGDHPAKVVYINSDNIHSYKPIPYKFGGNTAHSFVVNHHISGAPKYSSTYKDHGYNNDRNGHVESSEDEDSHESYHDINPYELDKLSKGYQTNYDHGQYKHKPKYSSSEYEEEDGSSHKSDDYSKHGKIEKKGHDSELKFSKGEKGSHDKEDHSGHYNEDGGNKKSHLDEASFYDDHHSYDKGSKGGKFGEKKDHKKGSKTTGYHNVYHKDEFKKDHTFYDDANHKGDFSKHGDEKKYHSDDSGDYKKGYNHDSGHNNDHKSKKGSFDKGHYDNEDIGYNKKHGYDSSNSHEDEYYKKGGSRDGHEGGYKKYY